MAFDLAPTTSADTETFDLTEGQEITLSIYTADGSGAPARSVAYIDQLVDTGPDVWKLGVGAITNGNDTTVWRAVGSWRVRKPASASAYGVLGS